jgi:hypothetical protein
MGIVELGTAADDAHRCLVYILHPAHGKSIAQTLFSSSDEIAPYQYIASRKEKKKNSIFEPAVASRVASGAPSRGDI